MFSAWILMPGFSFSNLATRLDIGLSALSKWNQKRTVSADHAFPAPIASKPAARSAPVSVRFMCLFSLL